MHTGTIQKIFIDKGYGFISAPNFPKNVFFHCRDLGDGLQFDEQLTERRVMFDVVGTEKGDRARSIRPAV